MNNNINDINSNNLTQTDSNNITQMNSTNSNHNNLNTLSNLPYDDFDSLNNYEPINVSSNIIINKKEPINITTIICILILGILVYINFIMPIFSKTSTAAPAISSKKSLAIHNEILSEIKDTSTTTSSENTSAASIVTSYEDLIQFVYTQMVQQKIDINITYKGTDAESIITKIKSEQFRNDLCSIDDKNTTKDYDYMYLNAFGYTYNLGASSNSAKIKIHTMWYENAAQTDFVDAYSKALIEKLKLKDMDSNYEKMKTVHDYIISITSYDHEFAKRKDSFNENTNIEEYAPQSAYNLIKYGSTVCTGYSLLYYKVLTDLGIDCRIVTSETHAWNIVKMDDKWYHVDLTWDDADFKIFKTQYFLKGSSVMNMDSSHKLEDKFLTKEFESEFPISTLDY